jgi:hypothetical protein
MYIIDECNDAGVRVAEVRADAITVHQLAGSEKRGRGL